MRTRFFGKIEEPFDGICVRSLFSVWSWCLISKWQLPAKLQAIQQKPLGILRIYRIISPYFSSNEIWGKYWFVISFLGICNKIFIFFLKALPKSHGEFGCFKYPLCQKMQPVVKYVIRSLNVLWRVLSLNSILSF